MTHALLQNEYEFLRRFLFERTSVLLPPGKEYVAETRLVPVLTLFDCRNLAALVQRLREGPTDMLMDHVVDALTNHETSWLRDPGLFDALYTSVLPELVQNRADDRCLSIWSAGCSTGQEPYSIAMLLTERFPQLRGWRIEILGTDVSNLALRRAEEATYSNLEMKRGLPEDWRSRFFEPVSSRWRMREDVRRMVTFRPQHLLAGGAAIRRFDLVLLCNVLLYFDDDTRRRALAHVEGSLMRDGFLILDRTMTTTGIAQEFLRVERVGSFEMYRPR